MSTSFDVWRVVWVFIFVVLLATVLGLFAGRLWWVLELAAHFPMLYAALAAVLALICLVGRKWRRLQVTAGVIVINLCLILPLYWGQPTVSDPQNSIRVLSANVLSSNRQHDRLLELVRAERPDVVLIMEVNRAWMESLSSLGAEYPHRISRPREDNFGIALWSKLPTDRLEIVELGTAGVPSVIAELSTSEGKLTLIGTHPLPPTSSENARLRNAQLSDVAQQAAEIPGAVIVMGDLNVTPWSPYFRDLLHIGGLENSMQGFGIQPTWSWIPIDHALHSADVAIVDRRVGPPIGSDHLPVVVDVALEQE